MSITDSRTQGPDGGPLGANAPQNALGNPEDNTTPMMDSSAVVIWIHDKSESNGNQFQFDDDGPKQTASSSNLVAEATAMLEQLDIHPEDSASEKQVEKPQEEDDICVLCMDPIMEMRELPCGHRFCAGCLRHRFEQCEPRCPSCGPQSAIICGNQPRGIMMINFHPKRLSGYEEYPTLVLEYRFRNGIQNDKHPNPGRLYYGTYKKAYLPYSPEGKEVYELLRRAFDARLIFTIGRTTPNGLDDQIVWSDIPHKTKLTGEYGYPDPGYLARVKEELRGKGIVTAPTPAEDNHSCNLL